MTNWQTYMRRCIRLSRKDNQMKTINEMKCTFPSLSVNEAYARTAVTAFAAQLDLTIEEIADIRTAVSEAVTNAIVHGYRGTVGTIELCVKLLEGNEVYIRIKDSGCGIPDVAQAMEPLYTTAAAEERAGLGFASWKASWTSCPSKARWAGAQPWSCASGWA